LDKLVVSTFATSPSRRVIGLVAAALTTKVKNKDSVTFVYGREQNSVVNTMTKAELDSLFFTLL
jgi:hypothetical protein